MSARSYRAHILKDNLTKEKWNGREIAGNYNECLCCNNLI